MNGVMLIDKPEGMTSHDVVRKIRRVCRTRRVGHAGTLDPMATGLLLVAVGEATRIVEYLMAGNKTYRATLHLGVETDTQDAEGQIVARQDVAPVDKAEVLRVMATFLGEQQQIPPMYSALKKNGIALHRLARKGVEVERDPRTIFIERLALLEMDWPRITFEVDCSKGTYVRTLCHDMGLRLGTVAHMTELRRIRSGSFSLDEANSLQEIEDRAVETIPELLLPLAEGLRDYSSCQLQAEAVRKLRHGIPPRADEFSSATVLQEGQVVVLKYRDCALAIGRYAPQRSREKRGDIELCKVFNPASPPGEQG
jgi:tRNA pseudouridine55 synthase